MIDVPQSETLLSFTKISKNTKRLQHVIEELKNIKSENIDGDIYDEFENALNDLNHISKNFKKGSNKYK